MSGGVASPLTPASASSPDAPPPPTQVTVGWSRCDETYQESLIDRIRQDGHCRIGCGGKKCKHENYEKQTFRTDVVGMPAGVAAAVSTLKQHEWGDRGTGGGGGGGNSAGASSTAAASIIEFGKPAIHGLNSSFVGDVVIASQRPSTSLFAPFGLIEQFRAKNISGVFNLQEKGEHSFCGPDGIYKDSGFSYNGERDFQRHGICYYEFPWPDMTAPENDIVLRSVQCMDHHIGVNHSRVLVHCHAGLGRTGLMIACYFILAQRMRAVDAIDLVRWCRLGSIQTKRQEQFCQGFERHVFALANAFTISLATAGPMMVGQGPIVASTLYTKDARQMVAASNGVTPLIDFDDFLKRQYQLLHGEESRTYRHLPRFLADLLIRVVAIAERQSRVVEMAAAATATTTTTTGATSAYPVGGAVAAARVRSISPTSLNGAGGGRNDSPRSSSLLAVPQITGAEIARTALKALAPSTVPSAVGALEQMLVQINRGRLTTKEHDDIVAMMCIVARWFRWLERPFLNAEWVRKFVTAEKQFVKDDDRTAGATAGAAYRANLDDNAEGGGSATMHPVLDVVEALPRNRRHTGSFVLSAIFVLGAIADDGECSDYAMTCVTEFFSMSGMAGQTPYRTGQAILSGNDRFLFKRALCRWRDAVGSSYFDAAAVPQGRRIVARVSQEVVERLQGLVGDVWAGAIGSCSSLRANIRYNREAQQGGDGNAAAGASASPLPALIPVTYGGPGGQNSSGGVMPRPPSLRMPGDSSTAAGRPPSTGPLTHQRTVELKPASDDDESAQGDLRKDSRTSNRSTDTLPPNVVVQRNTRKPKKQRKSTVGLVQTPSMDFGGQVPPGGTARMRRTGSDDDDDGGSDGSSDGGDDSSSGSSGGEDNAAQERDRRKQEEDAARKKQRKSPPAAAAVSPGQLNSGSGVVHSASLNPRQSDRHGTAVFSQPTALPVPAASRLPPIPPSSDAADDRLPKLMRVDSGKVITGDITSGRSANHNPTSVAPPTRTDAPAPVPPAPSKPIKAASRAESVITTPNPEAVIVGRPKASSQIGKKGSGKGPADSDEIRDFEDEDLHNDLDAMRVSQ